MDEISYILEKLNGLFSSSENVKNREYSYFWGLKSLTIGVTPGKKEKLAGMITVSYNLLALIGLM